MGKRTILVPLFGRKLTMTFMHTTISNDLDNEMDNISTIKYNRTNINFAPKNIKIHIVITHP